MFAANDARLILWLIDNIRERLAPTKDRQSVETVRKAVVDAYRGLFEERFFAGRLSRYGFDSFEQFRREGLAVFGPELMASFSKEIDAFDLGISLIAYGFDKGPPYGHQHIFTVENPGVVYDCDLLGFGIAGSGHDPALATLLSKPLKQLPVVETVWRLCEAKFSAEAAFAVGKETTVIILREDGKTDWISPMSLKAIREVWEKEQHAGISPEASKAVRLGLLSLMREIDRDEPKVVDILKD